MSFGDALRVPQLPAMTPQAINSEIARLWQHMNALAGRSESSQIRDNLQVLGDVQGNQLVGSGLTLGAKTFTPSDPSLAPDSDIPGYALNYEQQGGTIDVLADGNPFSLLLKDEFMGNGSSSGTVGDLGWRLTGGFVSPAGASVIGHPGYISFEVNFGAVGHIRLAPVSPFDLGYMAYVVRPNNVSFTRLTVGWSGVASPAAIPHRGAFFYYDTTDTKWRVGCQDGAGLTSIETDVPLVAGNWYLLEMNHKIDDDGSSVDFSINRQQGFRIKTNIPSGEAFPAIALQETLGDASSLLIDRFILAGRSPLAERQWT